MRKIRITTKYMTFEKSFKLKNMICPECGSDWFTVLFISALANWTPHEGLEWLEATTEDLDNAAYLCNSCEYTRPLEYELL